MWREEVEWSRSVGLTHRTDLSTFQEEQIWRRSRWDLGWFEASFRVSEIPSVEAKDSCFRTGQPQDCQV